MLSMQTIRYETNTGVRDVGEENNTSDETSFCETWAFPLFTPHFSFALLPHDGEHISIQLMYRT